MENPIVDATVGGSAEGHPNITLRKPTNIQGDGQDLRDLPGRESIGPWSSFTEPPFVKPPIQLFRFYGDEGDSIETFIEEVEDMSEICQWSPNITFQQAAAHLCGPARRWFRIHCREVDSWEALKPMLRRDFGSQFFSGNVEKELDNRKYMEGEPLLRYAEDVLYMCGKVDINMTNDTKLLYLISGFNNSDLLSICFLNFTSVEQFLEYCRKVDKVKAFQEKRGINTNANINSSVNNYVNRNTSRYANRYNSDAGFNNRRVEHNSYDLERNNSRWSNRGNPSWRPQGNRAIGNYVRPGFSRQDRYQYYGGDTARQSRQNFGWGHQAVRPNVRIESRQITNVPSTAIKSDVIRPEVSGGTYGRREGRPPVICFYCNGPGHFARNCDVKREDLRIRSYTTPEYGSYTELMGERDNNDIEARRGNGFEPGAAYPDGGSYSEVVSRGLVNESGNV